MDKFSAPTPRARRHGSAPAARPALLLEALEDRCLPSADVVLEWNAVALDALKNDSLLAHPRLTAGADLVFTTNFPNIFFNRAPGAFTNFGQTISLGGIQ